jgi:small subunit ribosomal protein S3
MSHKINPISYRLGINKQWQSRWFIKGVVAIEIERTANECRVLVRAARPGFVIGRAGKGIEDLVTLIKKQIKKKLGYVPNNLSVNIEELKRNEIYAPLIAQQVAWDIEKRMPYRGILKKQIENIMQNKEVKGVKIRVAGRLNGAEISRDEKLSKGSLPLSTLRANIDYGTATAFCTYGAIGVKVWIYKGEIFENEE